MSSLQPTLELTSQSADLEVEERVGKGEGHITAGSLQEQRHRLFVQMHSETVPNVAMQVRVPTAFKLDSFPP